MDIQESLEYRLLSNDTASYQVTEDSKLDEQNPQHETLQQYEEEQKERDKIQQYEFPSIFDNLDQQQNNEEENTKEKFSCNRCHQPFDVFPICCLECDRVYGSKCDAIQEQENQDQQTPQKSKIKCTWCSSLWNQLNHRCLTTATLLPISPERKKSKKSDSLEECKYCKNYYEQNEIQDHIDQECPQAIFECKSCLGKFLRQHFLEHQFENCYQKGKEIQMFEKIQNSIQQQYKEIQKYKITSQQKIDHLNNQIQFYQQHPKIKIVEQLRNIGSKNKILNDFDQGIFHINSMQLLLDIINAGLEVRSIIINTNDLQEYKFCRNSDQDFRPLIQLMHKLANLGDSNTQYSLGFIFFKGDMDIRQEFEIALNWAKMSADQNNQYGIYLLSMLYCYGQPYIPINLDQANKGFEKTINLFDSQFQIAFSQFTGRGMKKDQQQAIQIMIKLSERHNYSKAQNFLGSLYELGEYLEKNYQNAFYYHIKAAQQGDLESLKYIAVCYNSGLGIEQNKSKAYYFSEKAKKIAEQQTYK